MLIQKLRLQKGWSQEQLALLTGLSVRTIQRIERGQTSSVESLKALAAVFEVDFSSLKETDMQDLQKTLLSPEETFALVEVRQIKGFYSHLMQYVFCIILLAILNIAISSHYLWFLWVALGWGTGVLAHGLEVYNKLPIMDAAWERQQVEKRLGRKL